MKRLIAEFFFNDPDVIRAQETLLQLLKKHRAILTQICPPDYDREKTYQEFVDDISRVRGGALFYPYVGSGMGNGPFVELEDGSVKYDFLSGIGVHHLGHSHPDVVKAALNGALMDTIMQGHVHQTRHAHTFSKKLLHAANANGAQLEHCFLSTTGVMAGENALKIAFQKKFPANRILAFKKNFAGRTLAFAQITDKPLFREGLPTVLDVDYVPFFDPNDPEKSTEFAVKTLKEHIARYPKLHAGMIFELIQGEGGFYPGSHEFHKALMTVCKESNIAVLVDEVQTFARTQSLLAFQYYNLDKFVDIVWIGKASQVCATLFKAEYKPKPGLIAQTFSSSTTAIIAGEVILDHLLSNDYFGPDGKISKLRNAFINELEKIKSRNPSLLGGPFGEGIMIAFTPYDGNAEKVNAFVKELFKNGVIGFVAGSNPTRARFLIPVAATEINHIKVATKIIEDTLISLV